MPLGGTAEMAPGVAPFIAGAADFPYFHGGPVAWRTHAAANMWAGMPSVDCRNEVAMPCVTHC